jgi:hypothetical protein
MFDFQTSKKLFEHAKGVTWKILCSIQDQNIKTVH